MDYSTLIANTSSTLLAQGLCSLQRGGECCNNVPSTEPYDDVDGKRWSRDLGLFACGWDAIRPARYFLHDLEWSQVLFVLVPRHQK